MQTPRLRDPSKSLHARIVGWRRLAIAGFLLVVVAIVALLVSNQAIYRPALRDAMDATTASRLTHEAMLDQHAALRAYLVTGDERFLEAYDDGRRALPDLNREVARLTRGNADATSLLLDLRLAQAAWIDGWADEALDAGRAGGTDDPSPLVEGKALFDEYRLAHDSLIDELARERAVAFRQQTQAIQRTAGLALAVTVGFGLVAVWRARALRTSLDDALDSVLDHLSHIRDGDLQPRPPLVGPSELQRVDAGLDETAGALAQARAQVEEQAARVSKQNRQLGQVLALAREVAGSLSLRYILRGVCTAAAAIADDRRAVVWLRSEEAPEVIAHADTAGPGMEVVGLEPIALGDGPVGRAARYGRVEGHRAGLLAAEEDLDLGGSSADADEIAVPMVVGAQVIGVLQIGGPGARELDTATLNVIEALAVQAATAIASARLYEQTESLAMTDALTRLPNRRRLEDDLAKEVGVSTRYGRPLAFAMLDVDHFKSYNDELGHQAGDVALQELAGLLATSVRAGDTVYRYGGEELAIVMRETDIEGSRRHAERVREAVEHHFAAPGQPRAVTVSIGVAAMPLHASAGAQLVAAADLALYAAKRSGRNRTCVADPAHAALAH